MARGDKTIDKVAVVRVCEKKRIVEGYGKKEQSEAERQAGIRGQWQLESPARKYLEQVKCYSDTDCTPRMMKQSIPCVDREGTGEEYKSNFRTEVKATEWAFDRIMEAFEKVGKVEARNLSTVPEIMIRSTDYLRRIIAPAGGQGGVTMSYLCPHYNSFPMENLRLVGLMGKNTQIGGLPSGEKYDWRAPNRRLVVKVLTRPRSSKRMQYLRACVGI